MNMKRKDELNRIIKKAQEELHKINDAEAAKANKTLVGKFFKYRNRDSSEDSWWLYTAVTGITDNGYPIAWNFEKDCYGKIEVESARFTPSLLGGYIEITEKEFMKAYDDILAELNARKKE